MRLITVLARCFVSQRSQIPAHDARGRMVGAQPPLEVFEGALKEPNCLAHSTDGLIRRREVVP